MRSSLRSLCVLAFHVAGAQVVAAPHLHAAEAAVFVAGPAVSGALRVAPIALSVQNVERSSRWYRRILGFRIKASHPQWRYQARASEQEGRLSAYVADEIAPLIQPNQQPLEREP